MVTFFRQWVLEVFCSCLQECEWLRSQQQQNVMWYTFLLKSITHFVVVVSRCLGHILYMSNLALQKIYIYLQQHFLVPQCLLGPNV